MAALFRRIGTAQPYSDAVAITPSDTINLTKVAQGLHIGVGGTVTARNGFRFGGSVYLHRWRDPADLVLAHQLCRNRGVCIDGAICVALADTRSILTLGSCQSRL
jgi:hypothetical protein